MDTGVTTGRRRWAAVAVAATALLVACQPAQEPVLDGSGPAPGSSEAVADQPPSTLGELTDRAGREAARWQDSPRLAQVRVELEDGGWTQARATFVAPGAQRLFVVEWTAQGREEHRPSLAGLGYTPIPEEALAAVPALPDDARQPGDLAAAGEQALAECGASGPATAVLYTSGAPDGWQPDAGGWSRPPAWTATVTTSQGSGVTLDPVTGEPQPSGCFTAQPDEAS